MKNKKSLFSHLMAVSLLVLSAVLLTGCVSKRKVTYLNDVDEYYSKGRAIPTDYTLKIQPDDQLAISVSASEKELLEPFCNKVMIGSSSINGMTSISNRGGLYFTVDKDGFLEFPVFGLIKVSGYNRYELARELEKRFKEGGYVQDPVVSVEIMSFKVTVIGEAGNTSITCQTDRLTILEAIAKSGGILYTGKRQDALVLREENGLLKSYRVDLSDAKSTIESPVYYLKQNDVIYVEPNGAARVEGSPLYKYMAGVASVLGFITSIVTAVYLITK